MCRMSQPNCTRVDTDSASALKFGAGSKQIPWVTYWRINCQNNWRDAVKMEHPQAQCSCCFARLIDERKATITAKFGWCAGKCRKIVGHFKHLPLATTHLEDIQKGLQMPTIDFITWGRPWHRSDPDRQPVGFAGESYHYSGAIWRTDWLVYWLLQ